MFRIFLESVCCLGVGRRDRGIPNQHYHTRRQSSSNQTSTGIHLLIARYALCVQRYEISIEQFWGICHLGQL